MLQHIDALIAFVGVILVASLIVTVLTQMIVVAFNLRGKKLIWGLSTLLKQLDPSLELKAESIARKIVGNPAICKYSSKKKKILRLPNIIRSEEFSELLVKFIGSEDFNEFDQNTKEAIQKLVKFDVSTIEDLFETLPDMLKSESQEAVEKVKQELFDQLTKAKEKVAELEKWFDRVTDRVSEKFSYNSKVITICFSVVVAVFLQLDSIQLMKQVYSDSELRASLVANAEHLMEHGSDLLEGGTYFDKIYEELRRLKVKQDGVDKIKYPGLPMPDESFVNRVAAETWIDKHEIKLEELELDKDKIISDFNSLLVEKAPDHFKYLGEKLVALNKNIDLMQFKIIGEKNGWAFWKIKPIRIPGVIITIFLLQLGAPFWFNSLRKLMNLKSSLMNKEAKEREERKQNNS